MTLYSQQIYKFAISRSSSSSATTVDTARDLGVIVDGQLTMSAHLSAVCRSTYSSSDLSHECYRPKPRRECFMHDAFISSRLDYCNVLLFGISDNLLRRLQAVTLQRVLLLVLDVVSTSRRSYSNFNGCRCDSALNSSRQFWCTKRCMACFHHIWRITASLPLLPADVATCEVPRTCTSRSFTLAGRTASVEQCLSIRLHLRDSELDDDNCSPGVPPVIQKTHLFC